MNTLIDAIKINKSITKLELRKTIFDRQDIEYIKNILANNC